MRKNNFHLISVILILSLILIVFPKSTLAANPTANTYYVSVKGNDSNPGTETRPWKTIQKAADSVQPGDTVLIRDGVYRERVILSTSGSENHYITFTNYPGETVTIDGSGIDWNYDWGSLFDLNEQSYIKVIDLKVINSKWFGIGSTPDDAGSQNIIIQNCSTYNTKASGIVFFRGKNITIDGNSVEKSNTGTSNTQEGISLARIDTFAITNNHVFNITNDIPGAGGEGIDVKNGTSNGIISNNTVNDVYKLGIYIDAFSQHEYNIEVYGNTVYNTTQGIIAANEDGGLLENVRVHNNLVYNSVNWGFAIAGWGGGKSHAMKDISFTNNTTYNIGDGGIYLNNGEAENVVVTNNIFGGGPDSSSAPIYVNGQDLNKITIDHNFLNRVSDEQPTGTNYLVGDPGFVNPGSDFHLKKNSLAINIGRYNSLS